MSSAIDRLHLLELMKSPELQLIEVLAEPEYLEAHLPGAINISLKELNATAVSGLDKSAPTVVY